MKATLTLLSKRREDLTIGLGSSLLKLYGERLFTEHFLALKGARQRQPGVTVHKVSCLPIQSFSVPRVVNKINTFKRIFKFDAYSYVRTTCASHVSFRLNFLIRLFYIQILLCLKYTRHYVSLYLFLCK